MNDIKGLIGPFRRSGNDALFRPTSYWSSFMRPAEDVPACLVQVRLTQWPNDYGWIDLDLHLGARRALITLSEVFDPLPDLLDWLKAVEDGDMPIGVTIDEEGSEACLIAHRFDDDRLLIAVVDCSDQKERSSAVVGRRDFVASFRREFDRFFESELCLDRWGGKECEADEYLASLLAHPFLE